MSKRTVDHTTLTSASTQELVRELLVRVDRGGAPADDHRVIVERFRLQADRPGLGRRRQVDRVHDRAVGPHDPDQPARPQRGRLREGEGEGRVHADVVGARVGSQERALVVRPGGAGLRSASQSLFRLVARASRP